jgi:ABC-type Mn2+/Zn2+ transport system ATPase subunit
MNDALIRLQDVSIGYQRPLLRPLSLELRRGEFWGMVGPNGAGKTTLAKTILGLLPPLGGKLKRASAALRLSYTPQRHRLNPSYPLTAFEVVLMGRSAYLPLGRKPQAEDVRRAEEELSRLEIRGLSGRLFRALSGGEQQRVLLARALAADPDLMVLDEPAEGMDLLGTSDILHYLKRVNVNGRMLVLMISHHLDDVLSAVDHLCFINQYANLFEAGGAEEMASSQRLSSLYGRRMETHRCAGKMHVHISEG